MVTAKRVMILYLTGGYHIAQLVKCLSAGRTGNRTTILLMNQDAQ